MKNYENVNGSYDFKPLSFEMFSTYRYSSWYQEIGDCLNKNLRMWFWFWDQEVGKSCKSGEKAVIRD